MTESDLNGSWDSFIESAKKLKANGDTRIIAHARDVKDIVIRTGIQPGLGFILIVMANRSSEPTHDSSVRLSWRRLSEMRVWTLISARGQTSGARRSDAEMSLPR